MKINFITQLVSVWMFSGAVVAAPWQYVMPQTTDLTSSRLVTTEFPVPTANLSREAVQFSYQLDAQQPLEAEAPAFVQQSQQYWLDVTAGQLAQGVDLPISAAGAVVRISPLQNRSQSFSAQAQSSSKSIPAVIDKDSILSLIHI